MRAQRSGLPRQLHGLALVCLAYMHNGQLARGKQARHQKRRRFQPLVLRQIGRVAR